MKKQFLTIALLLAVTFSYAQAPAKIDTLKWTVDIKGTHIRNQILHMIDTSSVVINNSDILAKDRTKTVDYLRAIMNYMNSQFQMQNLPKEQPKKK